ncbi:ECF transporter S component [Clostridium perfringens]|uniref:ECF transporter S component n=1 Tax=Clostridium perfringens TaxID=1502 RepID=UPI0039E8BAAA
MFKFQTRQIAVTGILFAITIILGSTGIGFIPIPPLKLTIMHIPVIIASIIEGPLVGGLNGLLFGLFSMFQAATNPTPVSFIFLNPIVAIVPRIFIGIVPYYAYKIIKTKKDKLNLSISILLGSFTNTIGVMGLIYILYLNEYAKAIGISIESAKKIIDVYILNGFISGSVSIMIALPVILTVRKNRKKHFIKPYFELKQVLNSC